MTHQDLIELYAAVPNPPALRGLDAVDWATVRHAYGPATDVPAMLRALVSQVPEHRQFACAALFETIWHQGTVYEATAVAVPFLYALLEDVEAPDKQLVAFIVSSIAEGRGNLECNVRSPEDVALWERILTKQGKTLSVELARERDYIAAIKLAVESRLDILFPYLHDPEPEVRCSVAIALGYFPQTSSHWLPDLQIAFQNETHDATREALHDVINCLTERRT